MTVEQIVEETRNWPDDAVAELIDRIALAKHGGVTTERETAWTDVAARRSAELESGQSPIVPGEQVSARVRKIIGR